MKATVFIMIILLCCSAPGFADTLKDEDEVKQFADNVIETVVLEGVFAAFDKMKPYVLWDDTQLNSVATQSNEQRDNYSEMFGKSVSYEFVAKNKVGTCLIRLQYIEKAEKHAFPWSFYFYRTEQGWILTDFYWHGDIKKLFPEEDSNRPVQEAN